MSKEYMVKARVVEADYLRIAGEAKAGGFESVSAFVRFRLLAARPEENGEEEIRRAIEAATTAAKAAAESARKAEAAAREATEEAVKAGTEAKHEGDKTRKETASLISSLARKMDETRTAKRQEEDGFPLSVAFAFVLGMAAMRIIERFL